MKVQMWETGSRPAGTYGQKRRKYSGFTLLELLVVLVIATLILGVVTPRLFAVMPGVELKTSTQQLAAIMRQARSQAIAESRVIKVEYDSELPGIHVSGKKRVYSWPDSIDLSLQSDNPEHQAEIQPLIQAEEKVAINFYPDGSSSGGSVVLKTDQLAYQITVHWLTGKVTIDGG